MPYFDLHMRVMATLIQAFTYIHTHVSIYRQTHTHIVTNTYYTHIETYRMQHKYNLGV